MLFLINALVSVLLPFLLARAIDLQVHVEVGFLRRIEPIKSQQSFYHDKHQHRIYTETAVIGDISQPDIAQAQNLQSAFEVKNQASFPV